MMACSFWGKERIQYPVQVACQLPEVLDQLQVGAEVWIDEGKPVPAVGLLVNGFGLWSVERKKRAEQAKEKAVSEGDGTLAPG